MLCACQPLVFAQAPAHVAISLTYLSSLCAALAFPLSGGPGVTGMKSRGGGWTNRYRYPSPCRDIQAITAAASGRSYPIRCTLSALCWRTLKQPKRSLNQPSCGSPLHEPASDGHQPLDTSVSRCFEVWEP